MRRAARQTRPAPTSIPPVVSGARNLAPRGGRSHRLTLFALALFHRGARDPILLQLRRRHETGGGQLAGAVLPRLPPSVVVLADDLRVTTSRVSRPR